MTRAGDDDVNRLRIALGRVSRTIDRQVGDGMTRACEVIDVASTPSAPDEGGWMTRTQLSVLGTVARQRSIPMGELSDVEGLNPTMLSRIVGKLEVAGLVQRAPASDDRRAVVVEVTAAGTTLHARLRRQRTALLADRLAGLSATQRDDLLAAIPALESLATAMRPSAPAASGATVRAGARR